MFKKKELSKLELISNLVAEKKFIHALKYSDELLKKYPQNAILINMKGFILFRLNKFELAENLFLEALTLEPNFFEVKFNLGRLYFIQKKYTQAIDVLNQAIQLNPNDVLVHYYLANSFFNCDMFEESVNLINSFISKNNSNDKDILNILAKSLNKINKIAEAKNIYRILLKSDPDNISYLMQLGYLMLAINNIDEAKNYFLSALQLDKNNYAVIYSLCFFTDYKLQESQINSFKLLELNSINFPAFFCLHKYYEDNKEWDKSYYYLEKVNKFLSNKYPFDLKKIEKSYKQLKSFYIFSKNITLPIEKPSFQLIFIVGLPRCGSTMVENVLMMNEQVFSLGEDQFFIKLINRLKGESDVNEKKFVNAFIDYRDYYLSTIKQRTQKKIIIDKSLNNFEYVGLIKKIFPEAKIINLQRDPLNQLWSCFKTNFESKQGLSYTHSQKSLVEMHKIYKNMINFWNEQNIKDFKTFIYEDLVLDKEKSFSELFKFVEINFELKYLEIQNNSNISKTASVLQVRKKISLPKNNFKNVYTKYIKFLTSAFEK